MKGKGKDALMGDRTKSSVVQVERRCSTSINVLHSNRAFEGMKGGAPMDSLEGREWEKWWMRGLTRCIVPLILLKKVNGAAVYVGDALSCAKE